MEWTTAASHALRARLGSGLWALKVALRRPGIPCQGVKLDCRGRRQGTNKTPNPSQQISTIPLSSLLEDLAAASPPILSIGIPSQLTRHSRRQTSSKDGQIQQRFRPQEGLPHPLQCRLGHRLGHHPRPRRRRTGLARRLLRAAGGRQLCAHHPDLRRYGDSARPDRYDHPLSLPLPPRPSSQQANTGLPAQASSPPPSSQPSCRSPAASSSCGPCAGRSPSSTRAPSTRRCWSRGA